MRTPHHLSCGCPSSSQGGGAVHPAFATLNYVAELEEMVVADASLFRSRQNFHQHAAHGVVVAMMASDEKAACAENPRVLGPEGEGGNGPVPP